MKLIINNQADWNKLQAMANKAIGIKPFQVELKTDYEKRSLAQNALLHAVFKDCAEKTSVALVNNAKWWKRELKGKLGLKEVHFGIDNHPTVIVISTSDYSKAQASDFARAIQAYMKVEYDADIDLPDEFNNNGE